MFALPLFPSNLKPYNIAFFGLVILFINRKNDFTFDFKSFFINSSIYLLMILSLLYSENLHYAFKKLETMASLIIFPMIFSLYPQTMIKKLQHNRNRYMIVFFGSVLLFNAISFIYHLGHHKSMIFIHYPTLNRIAQGAFNIHPIYLSMHICIALLFSFFIIIEVKSNYKKAVLIFLDFLLIGFLFILIKKGPVIVLGITFLLFLLFQRNKRLLYVGLAIMVINLVVISSIPEYREKFSELTKVDNVETGGITSTNIRYNIYKSSIKKIIESPLIGFGVGDHKDELLESLKKDSPILYEGKYNSHNQYISFTLSMGLIGLLTFLCFLCYNLTLAIRYDNQVLILLLIFYGLTMSFENILEREDGVIYFSFFIGYFALYTRYTHSLELNKGTEKTERSTVTSTIK